MNDHVQVHSAFINDERPQIRRLAVQVLGDAPPGKAEPQLVLAMEDPDATVWQAAMDVLLTRQPWLVLRPFAVRDVPSAAMETDQGKAWKALRDGFYLRAQGRPDWPNPEILSRWKKIPGVIPDIVDALRNSGNHAMARSAADERSFLAPEGETRNQILVAPTYGCNLNCVYCYVKGWHNLFPESMSLEDLDILLAWCHKQGIDTILLAGGEPTVYPYFEELLRRARRSDIRILLTTNTLYGRKIREMIHARWITELIAHYDQGLIHDGAGHRRFMKNINAAASAGVKLFLRYTLTGDSRKEEWRRLIKIAATLETRMLNYAFAFSSFFSNNLAVNYDIKEPGGDFQERFDDFVIDCRSADITLHLCKPIPLCAISKENLTRYLLDGTLRSACTAYLRGYSQNVTVNPDLSTQPCNAIGIRGPAISTFSSLADAGNHYRTVLKNILFLPYHESCRQCLLFYRGFCFGACLAEKQGMITERERPNVLPCENRRPPSA